MERLHIIVDWCDKNFALATKEDILDGSIVCTHSSYKGLIDAFNFSVHESVEYAKEHGKQVPEWLENGEYELDIEFTAAALIRKAEEYTSLSAISKVSGINLQQLSHYANGFRCPRPDKVVRIREAVHKIGQDLLAI